MKIVKFRMHCEMSIVGCERSEEDELEFEDDASEEKIEREIELYLKEWAFEQIDWWHEVIE